MHGCRRAQEKDNREIKTAEKCVASRVEQRNRQQGAVEECSYVSGKAGKKLEEIYLGKGRRERGKNSGFLVGSEAFNSVGVVVAMGSEQVIYW